jgi:hypothetical protein
MADYLLLPSAMTATASSSPPRRYHAWALRNSLLPTLAALAIFSSNAVAQISTGTLVGTVLDASGAAVPNAKLEARNADTGVVSAVSATESGDYRIGNLLAGRYSITASAAGFSTSTLQNVTVDANKIATQNMTLTVGQVSTNVEVTESVVNIDTTTATIQNTFDQQMVRDLPVSSIGLGVANLSLLSAGVASNGGIGMGDGPSVGGQRPRNNNFTIDGVDNNNKSVTGSLIREIPNDAVGEFTILQNQESAQYGHSSGGQFNAILKSGGNTFHGTAYEYFQNRNLNAIDQQVQNQAIASGKKPVNPRSDSNRFGGSIGGPAIKNKLFFFGLYEYNPVGQSATPASVNAPTAAGFSALSSIPGLNATNLAVFKQYVPVAAIADPKLAETVAGVTIPVGVLQFASPNYQNNQAVVTTVDYNISDKDKLSGRYIYNRLAQIDIGATLPSFYTFNNNVYHVASLAEYHNFSPTLVNELRIGYNRLNQPVTAGDFKYPGLDQFPDIVINDTLNLELGPNSNSPQTTIQNTYQLIDNLTWVKGRHTIQFGIDGRRAISPGTFTQRSRGDYEYGKTGQSITGLEAFLRDLTPDYLAQRSLGNPVYYGDQYATYEYLQDTWRVHSNLTINAGLRYEYTTVPVGSRSQVLNSIANVPGVLTFGEPQPQTKNFAPRIGLAYSPGSKGTTSIRAGFGIAYDVIYDNIGILALPPQLSTTADVTNSGDTAAGAPGFLANGGMKPNATVSTALMPAQARANTAAYVPDQKLPYSIQWNFGIQQVFARDYTFEARYLGTRGVHLDVQQRINKLAPVTAANSLPTYLTAPSQATLDSLTLTLPQIQAQSNLVPLFGNAGFTNPAFVEDSPIGNSTYHGMALQLNRRFSNGLQFQGAYTWSHLIDDSTADFNTTALTPRRAQDFQNLRADKSTSALDRRQRFTFAAFYEAPWFRKSNWIAKNIIGNWNFAPIYTIESGEMMTVQSGLDSNFNGDSASDRAIINPAGQDGVSSIVTALKNTSGATVAYLANNPNARYILAQSGAYPNGGRNTLLGRPINNIDLNILKNFNLTERFRVQFGAQFFNLLNHAQFVPGFVNRADNPVVLANTAVSRSLLIPGNNNFNAPENVFSSNPRNIQLSLKVTF